MHTTAPPPAFSLAVVVHPATTVLHHLCGPFCLKNGWKNRSMTLVEHVKYDDFHRLRRVEKVKKIADRGRQFRSLRTGVFGALQTASDHRFGGEGGCFMFQHILPTKTWQKRRTGVTR